MLARATKKEEKNLNLPQENLKEVRSKAQMLDGVQTSCAKIK